MFRVDWDVLFPDGRPDDGRPDALVNAAVAACLNAYRYRMADATVSTFLFSGSYDTGAIQRASSPVGVFDAWAGAFATRVFPALRILPELRRQNGSAPTITDWNAYAGRAFDESLARRFYGFAPSQLECDSSRGIAALGANPAVSVISGALLCLSDTAVLDLPPFSNFRLNVVWIDDHLKYALYRELRQLTSIGLRLEEPNLSRAKLDLVMLRKARARISDLPRYVLSEYLPRLLWGCVMDRWITGAPILKRRKGELSDPQATSEFIKLTREGSGAPYPDALQKALETQDFEARDQDDLVDKLTKLALERIEAVRRDWCMLGIGKVPTFASIWASGPDAVERYFPGLPALALGIPNRGVSEIRNVEDLNPSLGRQLEWLIEDATRYISYALAWPGLVRMVRSIPQGALCTDMSWGVNESVLSPQGGPPGAPPSDPASPPLVPGGAFAAPAAGAGLAGSGRGAPVRTTRPTRRRGGSVRGARTAADPRHRKA